VSDARRAHRMQLVSLRTARTRSTPNTSAAGIISLKLVYDQLKARNLVGLGLRMMLQPTTPSPGFWVTDGATTLWERILPDLNGRRRELQPHHVSGCAAPCWIGVLRGCCSRTGVQVWRRPVALVPGLRRPGPHARLPLLEVPRHRPSGRRRARHALVRLCVDRHAYGPRSLRLVCGVRRWDVRRGAGAQCAAWAHWRRCRRAHTCVPRSSAGERQPHAHVQRWGLLQSRVRIVWRPYWRLHGADPRDQRNVQRP